MKLIKKILKFVESRILKLDDQLEKFIPLAVNIVEMVKAVVENRSTQHVLDLVMFVIPGDMDDKIINNVMKIAREYIPRVALNLQIIKSILDTDNVNDQINAVMEALKNAGAENQQKYWHELAKQVLYVFADGKATWGEAAMLAEYYYQNKFKN